MSGWKTEKTGRGTGGDWLLVEDKEAEGGLALAQTKADGKALFNICVTDVDGCVDRKRRANAI